MYKILLDNMGNDKKLEIELPIVPRKGDWIELDYEDDFMEGESLITVYKVILNPLKKVITVIVEPDNGN